MENGNFRKAMPLLFFLSLSHSFVVLILPIYLSDIGFSGIQIGILVSVYISTTIFVSFPTGVINDKWTIRLTMITGALLFSAFFFGIGFFESFVIFLPLYFIGGFGFNLQNVSLRTSVFKVEHRGKEGRKFGIYSLVSAAASTVGLLAGGFLLFSLDFPTTFKIIGVLYLILIPFISIRHSSGTKIKLSQYKKDLLDSRVIFIGMIMFLFSTHWGAESTSFGLFLRNNLGMNIFWVSMYGAFTILFLGSAAYLFGKKIDMKKHDLKNVFIMGMFISGLFHVLHTIPIPIVSFVFRTFHEFGDGMAKVATFFWISKLFTKDRIGGNSSFMFTIMLFGQVTGALIYGPMGESMGYHVPLIVSGITTMIFSLLLILFVRTHKVR